MAQDFYSGTGTPAAPVNSFTDVLNSLANGIVSMTSGGKGTFGQLTTNGSNIYNAITNFLPSDTPLTSKPKAYLNWITLDEQLNTVSTYTMPIKSAATLTTLPYNGYNITKNGYIYIWVSNETPGWPVYFDNLKVVHYQGPLLEETHYYPFGLTMAGISSRALKTKYAQNNFKYNGKELQNQEFSDGTGLEEYDYGGRNYDPQLGRMIQIDPAASKFVGLSPYSNCANNPILVVDPNGEDWTLSLSRGKDGSWNLDVHFKGQVLNSSSNKGIDTKALSGIIKQQFESVFNGAFGKDEDGPALNVHATADITSIDKKSQLAKDATLIDIKDGNDEAFETNDDRISIVGFAKNGKELLLNEKAVSSFMDNTNKKTIAHEIGHTGGLRHPSDDPSNLIKPIVPYSRNPSNFMNQGTQFLFPFSNNNFTGVTKAQILRIFSLYSNGYLNKEDGADPIDRTSAPPSFAIPVANEKK